MDNALVRLRPRVVGGLPRTHHLDRVPDRLREQRLAEFGLLPGDYGDLSWKQNKCARRLHGKLKGGRPVAAMIEWFVPDPNNAGHCVLITAYDGAAAICTVADPRFGECRGDATHDRSALGE